MIARIGKGDGKQQILRHADALDFLEEALAAPPKSKLRQTYLEGALFAYFLGRINQDKFGARGDRRGAPNGKRGGRIDDSEALSLMAEIAHEGELAHSLAKRAVATGRVPLHNSQEASVVRRLAEKWRQAVQK